MKTMMSKYLAALALALSLNGLSLNGAFSTSPARADEPQKPDVTQSENQTKDKAVLTAAQLDAMLQGLGYETKDVSGNDSHNVFEISTEAEGWKILIMVSVSGDGSTIWFDSKFKPLSDVTQASAASWAKLLELSRTYNPAFFTLDKTGRIHVSATLDNFAVTPSMLRRELERFDSVVRKSYPHWKADCFTPAPKLESLTDAGRQALERLNGVWLEVGEVKQGVVANQADVQASEITYTFNGDSCKVTPKQQKAVEAVLRTVGGDGTLEVDMIFVDARQVQKALIKVEGDTMTICVAYPNQPRPTEFISNSEFKGMLLTLKRQAPAGTTASNPGDHLIKVNPFATP